MSSRTRPEDLLGHILDRALVPLELGATIDRDGLLSQAIDQRAAVRSLDVGGEATKRRGDILRQAHPGLPWKNTARTRARLIPDAEGVHDSIRARHAADRRTRPVVGSAP